jgi:hypothetical protein
MHPHRTPMVHVANALAFLEQEHQRLKQDACPSVKSIINSTATATRTNQEGPTEHELSTVFQFCQGMMEAIEAALLDAGQQPPERHLLSMIATRMKGVMNCNWCTTLQFSR